MDSRSSTSPFRSKSTLPIRRQSQLARIKTMSKGQKTLQVAQILADLNDLHIADPIAASALVNAFKTLDQPGRKASGAASAVSEAPQPDLATSGRTSRRTPASSSATPASLSRAESSFAYSYTSTQSDTVIDDEDMNRATTLMRLYQRRDRSLDLEMAGLRRARERIRSIEERYGD